MSFRTVFSTVSATLILSVPLTRAADDKPLTTDVDVKVASAFVWRGQVLNDEVVLQPSVTVSGGNLSFNLWGTWDLTDVDNSGEHTRMDATLDYTIVEDGHMLRPGFVGYVYYDDQEAQSKDTFEIFVEYACDVIFVPRLSVYYDFAEIEGFYTAFTVAHGFALLRDERNESKMDLDFRVGVGAGSENYMTGVFTIEEDTAAGIEAFEPDGGGLADLTAKASLRIVTGKNSMVVPAVKYSTLLDSDIVDALDDADQKTDQIVASITLSATF